MTEWTDARLGAVLRDIGANVAVADAGIADAVAARLDQPVPSHRRLRWLAVAAAIAVLALAVTAIAPAREAIANLLGIGTTTVQHVDRLPPTVPTTLPPGQGSDRDLRRELHTAGLAAPSRALVGDPVAWRVDAADETVVIWPRVALTQNRTTDSGVAMKLVPRDAGVVATTVTGNQALWVPGKHARVVNGTPFASEAALLWFANGTMYRLETATTLEQARAIANSVQPVR
jgi:hypothetical protein